MNTEDLLKVEIFKGLAIIGPAGCGKSHLLVNLILKNYEAFEDNIVHFVTNSIDEPVNNLLRQRFKNRILFYNSLQDLPELVEFERLYTDYVPYQQEHYTGKIQYIIFDDISGSYTPKSKMNDFLSHGIRINVHCILMGQQYNKLSTASKNCTESYYFFKDMSARDIEEFVFNRPPLCAEFIKSTVLHEPPRPKMFQHPYWDDHFTKDEAETFNITCHLFRQEYRKRLNISNPYSFVRISY